MKTECFKSVQCLEKHCPNDYELCCGLGENPNKKNNKKNYFEAPFSFIIFQNITIQEYQLCLSFESRLAYLLIFFIDFLLTAPRRSRGQVMSIAITAICSPTVKLKEQSVNRNKNSDLMILVLVCNKHYTFQLLLATFPTCALLLHRKLSIHLQL